uniref:SS18 subunit of BAF chromatin remodeling complex n=1 Tax=Eptatretus burgeri TaxID=7764 RepID=A0A8C4PXK3_EPTBU
MSLAFVNQRQRGKAEVNQGIIQKMLDENNQLIQCIMEYQSRGKASECAQYQQILHRNLVYLATIADSNQSTHIPADTAGGPDGVRGPMPTGNMARVPHAGYVQHPAGQPPPSFQHPQGMSTGPVSHGASNQGNILIGNHGGHGNQPVGPQADGMAVPMIAYNQGKGGYGPGGFPGHGMTSQHFVPHGYGGSQQSGGYHYSSYPQGNPQAPGYPQGNPQPGSFPQGSGQMGSYPQGNPQGEGYGQGTPPMGTYSQGNMQTPGYGQGGAPPPGFPQNSGYPQANAQGHMYAQGAGFAQGSGYPQGNPQTVNYPQGNPQAANYQQGNSQAASYVQGGSSGQSGAYPSGNPQQGGYGTYAPSAAPPQPPPVSVASNQEQPMNYAYEQGQFGMQ